MSARLMFRRAVSGLFNGDPQSTPELDSWWEKISDHYGESWRFYHTLEHIEDMLALSSEHCPTSLAESAEVGLSILFHDVIYVPKRPDNEEESARLFDEFAASTKLSEKNPELCSAVNEMIIATKAHFTECHESDNPGTSALHYFLDLDMAVLGRPATAYDGYAKQIRQEYCHIPEADFRRGRARVLEKFMKRKYIYTTAKFRSLFEERARANMRREIGQLKSTG